MMVSLADAAAPVQNHRPSASLHRCCHLIPAACVAGSAAAGGETAHVPSMWTRWLAVHGVLCLGLTRWEPRAGAGAPVSPDVPAPIQTFYFELAPVHVDGPVTPPGPPALYRVAVAATWSSRVLELLLLVVMGPDGRVAACEHGSASRVTWTATGPAGHEVFGNGELDDVAAADVDHRAQPVLEVAGSVLAGTSVW